ncbi:hypothetical protein LHP98_04135 [Rhodobacter sp. Har01]|uniref:hypothetical protein n=1 Tax=Rhodobacter sp. Har01 TaxID=2883999 RepID=UPI001D07E145|nr:hypothetical protein [Rhodobacter sp. Har01]MCB6177316.1 hypothetical protein [Rhodobacter sp. Har01]
MTLRRRSLLLALAVLHCAPARADCLRGTCDLDAIALIEAETGQPLPRDTEVIGALQGGFQDRFVQIRLEMSGEGLDLLTKALKADSTGKPQDFQLEISKAPWWDLPARSDIAIGEAKFGHFAFAFIAFGPAADKNRRDVYLLAFET